MSEKKRQLLLQAMEGCLSKSQFDLLQRKYFLRLVASLEAEHVDALRLLGGVSWLEVDGMRARLADEELGKISGDVMEDMLPMEGTKVGNGLLRSAYVDPTKVADKCGLPPGLFLELKNTGLAAEREERFRLTTLGADLLLFLTDEKSPQAAP